MDRVKPALKVVDGKPSAGKRPLEAAYEHFRLDRMGNRASPNTLAHYDAMVRPFLAWAVEEGVRRFEDLGVEQLRHYRALREPGVRVGRPLEGWSALDSHKALMASFRWASDDEYEVTQRSSGSLVPGAGQGGDGLPDRGVAEDPGRLHQGRSCGGGPGPATGRRRSAGVGALRPGRDERLAHPRSGRAARALGRRRHGSEGGPGGRRAPEGSRWTSGAWLRLCPLPRTVTGPILNV